jgi:hypothetical protein
MAKILRRIITRIEHVTVIVRKTGKKKPVVIVRRQTEVVEIQLPK